MIKTHLSRRSAMMIGAVPILMSLPFVRFALAQTPAAPAAPEFPGKAHTIPLGAFEVTTLLGGASVSENPIATFGLNADPAEFEALSAENFIPDDRTGGSFTLTLVKTPDALILFDAGMVAANNAASLAQAGYAPEDVTHIVLTHMHPDHVSGLMNGDTPIFANAQLIVPKVENDHWSANPSEAYTAHVAPLIDKARFLEDGEEVLPGIRAEAAYGHTPGHTTYLLESDGEKLLLTGDSFNHYVYSVQRPEWQVRFDMDKEMGIATRKAVLARLADEKIPFIGYHMPFPAIGYIAAQDQADRYRFVPATYQFAK